ncbi:DUF2306 domain-containing protein [Flagellimonas meridianipacifica]|nr:DUF2306 domain-containing protein [Allomuricauda pacifica]
MSRDIIGGKSNSTSMTLMDFAIKICFIVMAIGQFLFAFYVLVFYGKSSINGHFEKWGKVMPTGLIDGDLLGNLMLGIHLLFAFVITVGGPLQLMPIVRNNFRAFHRISGRLYIVTAFIASITGLYMIITRHTLGEIPLKLANALNAILIMWFAYLAIKTARERNFKAHQKWAIRLFIVVSGVWFIRIWYGFCRFIFEGKIPGSAPNLEGITNILIGFGSYLLPLLLIELFFLSKNRSSRSLSFTISISILLLAIVIAIGTYSFGHIWLKRLYI